jgi:hypothetical protein
MESECCGASEWLGYTGICSMCKEHAEFFDIDDIDNRWVILEEGFLFIAFLTEDEAKIQIEKCREIYPNLTYTLFYDEYYEYTEITKTN